MINFILKISRYIYYRIRSIIYHFYQYNILFRWIQFRQKFILSKIQEKDRISVVFFAMNLPMWRYQFLYEALSKHPNFDVHIVLSPCISFSFEQQKKDIEKLREFFDQKKISYIDYHFDDISCYDVKNELNPDILFYPQPSFNILDLKHDSKSFTNKLLCYYPYAFWTAYGDWSYDKPFHNVAWKLYYSTELHKKDAVNIAHNKGKNVVVVGYPNADNFLYTPVQNVWKPQNTKKKRIIWAPHFTIIKERSLVAHASFLWMADFMIEMADKYSEQIQIAFKPHPRLITELYLHPEWGKNKADSYYEKWRNMENGQLDEGEFKDLFMTSDAMIHDSGSFTVEYHYSLKPVMFVIKEKENYAATLCEFGKKALDAHYWGQNKKDIESFIENIVLKNVDTMYSKRKDFYDNYLMPPNEKSVTENTMTDLLRSLNKHEQ